MPVICKKCDQNRAILKRPKTGDAMCKECFFFVFEEEIHKTITDAKLFKPGDRIGIGASGGKDSTVLAYVLKQLNDRYNYDIELILLSIDEGITGYRDDSLESVKRNQENFNMQLKVVTYEELYGWTMDEIVKKVGRKNNCTFCGVFRRQALDRGAMLLNVNKLVTGHNADDIAETVLMNILRGDIGRLERCTSITTGNEGAIPRCKPFKYTYEKEIVMYAYFKKLDYFSTECVYSPNAYRGHARAFIKDLEAIRARSIIDIIHSGEKLAIKKDAKLPVQGICERCGYISSMNLCKACNLLEGLNKGIAKLGIGITHRLRKQYNLTPSYSLNSSMASLRSSELSLNSEDLCSNNDKNNNESCCNRNEKCCKSNSKTAELEAIPDSEVLENDEIKTNSLKI
jgi:cytoplasmic tRNA 2-thiolation protein 1